MIGRIGWNQQSEAQAHLQTFWSKLLACASRLPNETVRTSGLRSLCTSRVIAWRLDKVEAG
jgi:hypothetical protein